MNFRLSPELCLTLSLIHQRVHPEGSPVSCWGWTPAGEHMEGATSHLGWEAPVSAPATGSELIYAKHRAGDGGQHLTR